MSSHDEFRIRVQTGQAKALLAALRDASVGERERGLLGRVATTHEGDHVFIYVDSEDAASSIAAAVRETLRQRGIEGELTVWRWHPLEESWEDAAVPLPSTPEQVQAERERLEQLEDAESRAAGYAEWEVRVTVPSHNDARELADRLTAEGLPVRRQWRHLILGAEDELRAQQLAERIRAQAPAGSEAVVEGAGMPAWEALHPFAVFGGLAN